MSEPRIVMTMSVRDEGDVLAANLLAHRALGVDRFVILDNGSTDGTPAILERWAEAGLAKVIEAPDAPLREVIREWPNRLAHVAIEEMDPDWVIHDDADEIWWPLCGSLKEALAGIAAGYHAVLAPRVEFAARPDGPEPFWERLVIRDRAARVRPKLAHRAIHDVYVSGGAHRVASASLAGPSRLGRASMRRYRPDPDAAARSQRWHEPSEWLPPAPAFPIRILHFPLRSSAQYRRRVEAGLNVATADAGRPRVREIRSALAAGRIEEDFRALALGAADIERGLADGTLVEDTSFRDLMRSLPDPEAAPEPRAPLRAPAPPDRDALERELEDNLSEALRSMTLSESVAWLGVRQARAKLAASRRGAAARRRRAARLRSRVGRLERRRARGRARLARIRAERDRLRTAERMRLLNRARATLGLRPFGREGRGRS